MIKARIARLLGGSGGEPPQEIFSLISDLLRSFLVYSWGESLDDLLLNLVVVFEACRIKGVTPLRAASA